jgi:hypothetical protein
MPQLSNSYQRAVERIKVRASLPKNKGAKITKITRHSLPLRAHLQTSELIGQIDSIISTASCLHRKNNIFLRT